MKKEYKAPELGIARFSDNVNTAVSGTNGIDITEEALRQKNIEKTERAALSAFKIVY